jgi:hypothetical protein
MIHMTKRRAKASALLSFPGPGMGVNPGGCRQVSDKSLALAVLAPGAPVPGCGAPAPQGPHAIHVARDRAILVTPAAPGGAVRLAWQHAPLRSRSLPGWARIWPAPERRWRSAFRPPTQLVLGPAFPVWPRPETGPLRWPLGIGAGFPADIPPHGGLRACKPAQGHLEGHRFSIPVAPCGRTGPGQRGKTCRSTRP